MRQKLLPFIMFFMMISVVGKAQLPDNRIPTDLQKAMLSAKATRQHTVRNRQSKILKTIAKAPKTGGQRVHMQVPLKTPIAAVSPIGYVAFSEREGLAGHFCQFAPNGAVDTLTASSCVPSAGGAIL